MEETDKSVLTHLFLFTKDKLWTLLHFLIQKYMNLFIINTAGNIIMGLQSVCI